MNKQATPGGYHTPNGYVGFLPNGRKMLFATEQDYFDYISGGERLEDMAG